MKAAEYRGTLGVVGRVAVVVVAVAVLLLVLVWALQRHLIYLPSDAPVAPAATVIPGARDVELRTSDGLTLGGWFVPARQPDRRVTELVASGNAGDRSARAPLATALAARGLAVLLFDYRGYGRNPGRPSEEGLARLVGRIDEQLRLSGLERGQQAGH